jgi:hypothetical protein
MFVAGAHCHAQVVYNNRNQPTLVSNLLVGGVPYDVSIQYETSFDALFTDFQTPSPLPTFWGNLSGAIDAINTLGAALNSANTLPDDTTVIAIPQSSGVWSLGDYVQATAASFAPGGTEYTLGPGGGVPPLVRLAPHVDIPGVGWATFTAVPEPASWALLGAGLIALAYGRRLVRARGNEQRGLDGAGA